ncbi:unnamed protein product, partial [Effrenium voratum]
PTPEFGGECSAIGWLDVHSAPSAVRGAPCPAEELCQASLVQRGEAQGHPLFRWLRMPRGRGCCREVVADGLPSRGPGSRVAQGPAEGHTAPVPRAGGTSRQRRAHPAATGLRQRRAAGPRLLRGLLAADQRQRGTEPLRGSGLGSCRGRHPFAVLLLRAARSFTRHLPAWRSHNTGAAAVLAELSHHLRVPPVPAEGPPVAPPEPRPRLDGAALRVAAPQLRGRGRALRGTPPTLAGPALRSRAAFHGPQGVALHLPQCAHQALGSLERAEPRCPCCEERRSLLLLHDLRALRACRQRQDRRPLWPQCIFPAKACSFSRQLRKVCAGGRGIAGAALHVLRPWGSALFADS